MSQSRDRRGLGMPSRARCGQQIGTSKRCWRVMLPPSWECRPVSDVVLGQQDKRRTIEWGIRVLAAGYRRRMVGGIWLTKDATGGNAVAGYDPIHASDVQLQDRLETGLVNAWEANLSPVVDRASRSVMTEISAFPHRQEGASPASTRLAPVSKPRGICLIAMEASRSPRCKSGILISVNEPLAAWIRATTTSSLHDGTRSQVDVASARGSCRLKSAWIKEFIGCAETEPSLKPLPAASQRVRFVRLYEPSQRQVAHTPPLIIGVPRSLFSPSPIAVTESSSEGAVAAKDDCLNHQQPSTISLLAAQADILLGCGSFAVDAMRWDIANEWH